MKMQLSMRPQMEMRMKLAPQIIQSIEILQLNILELQETIKEELLENPTLELKEGSDSEPESAPEPTPAEDQAQEAADEKYDVLEQLQAQMEAFSMPIRRSQWDGGASAKMEAMQNTPARSETLQDHLFGQFNLMEVSDRAKKIARSVIYNIGDNGYLAFPLEDIVEDMNRELFGIGQRLLSSARQAAEQSTDTEDVRDLLREAVASEEPKRSIQAALLDAMDRRGFLAEPQEALLSPFQVTLSESEEVLRLVQQMEPPGVGARDTVECLLLQLAPDDPKYDLKAEIIRNHLEEVRQNRLPQVAKATGFSIEEIKLVIGELAVMNPTPGADFAAATAPVITPDVVIEHIDGRYEIRLEDSYIPRVGISAYYRDLLLKGKLSDKEKKFLEEKLESARRLVSAIDQRQRTLHRVAAELVSVQRDFLDEGITHLKPLRMQEIADALGIHVATVSRAVKDKYMQTPRGIFKMKFFFSGSMRSTEGDNPSRASVQSMIREIIEKEDKKKPLTDGQIVKQLEARGLKIARRTITKYREAMKLASSRQRKEY